MNCRILTEDGKFLTQEDSYDILFDGVCIAPALISKWVPIQRVPAGRLSVSAIPIGRLGTSRVSLGRQPLKRIPPGRLPITRVPIDRIEGE